MTLGKLISGLITRPSERRLAKLGHAALVIAAWRDNVVIKRQWRTVKNEERYLRANPACPRLAPGSAAISASTAAAATHRLAGKLPEPVRSNRTISLCDYGR